MQLRDWLEETAERLDERMNAAERRIDGSVTHTSLVRYDAYGEMSGPPVEQRRAARLAAQRRGGVGDPPPRPGARVRQAHARGRLRGRALAGGARGRGDGHGRRAQPAPDAGRLPRPGRAPTARRRSGRPRRRASRRCPAPRSTRRSWPFRTGLVDRAVVPIENALEGGVAATLDALAGEADRVRIAGEVVHPIHHCLVAARRARARGGHARGVAPPGERPVRALPARAPARGPSASTAPSTADAVMTVRNGDGTAAALGSRLAAELYDCRVLAENVEDRPDNVTRFVWLAPAGESADPGPDAKTSIVFWGAGDESPGWLVEVLRQFADRGVNLTRIESRPAPGPARPLHVLRRPRRRGRAAARERGARGAARPGRGDPRARLLPGGNRRAAERLLARLAATWRHAQNRCSQPGRVTPNQALCARCRAPAGLSSAVVRPAGYLS